MYQSSCSVPDRGYWCRPTLFSVLPPNPIASFRGDFGPVLAIQTFRTLEEGITKANNTPYGLSGGVWTDKGAIFKMTQSIERVSQANTFFKFDPTSPFVATKKRCRARGQPAGLDAYVTGA